MIKNMVLEEELVMEQIKQDEFTEQPGHGDVISAEEFHPEDPYTLQTSRRDIIRLTLASLVGLVFARADRALAQAGSTLSGSPLAQERWTFLPAGIGAGFMKSRLLSNPVFQRYHKYFTAQGYEFIPERVQLATDTPGEGPTRSKPDKLPARLLAIAPSFRRFTPRDPSHTAVSITATFVGGTIFVAAGVANVNHKPFSISSFEIVELDEKGRPSKHTVDAAKLKGASPEDIAREMGAPIAKLPQPERRAAQALSAELAAIAYKNILTDRYARPLYPPGAVDTLLAETPLVQKMAQVNHAFYIRKAGGSACCCCTCCCCNGSCSCCI
jgi:hypothetical protein